MTENITYIDNLSKDERDLCSKCSVAGMTYRGIIPFPVCLLARLAKNLGKIPTYREAQESGIDTTVIPPGCVNGFISW